MRMNMDEKPAKRERKPPPKISRKYLENAALFYLQRYATSAQNLKDILMRKVRRSCSFHQVPAKECAPLVEEIVTRYMAAGLVDDTVFARARVASLRRQGCSRRAIIARLQAKGLSRSQVEGALRHVDAEQEEHEDPETAAAITCARRKKLGHWRKTPLTDPKDRQKELATLGRAGFSHEAARRALESVEEN